jgi:hypothetical protein
VESLPRTPSKGNAPRPHQNSWNFANRFPKGSFLRNQMKDRVAAQCAAGGNDTQ